MFPGSRARNEIPYGLIDGSSLHTWPRFVCRPPCEYPAQRDPRAVDVEVRMGREIAAADPERPGGHVEEVADLGRPRDRRLPAGVSVTAGRVAQHHVPVVGEAACVRRVVGVVLGRTAAVEDLEQREAGGRRRAVGNVHVGVQADGRSQRVRRRHRDAVGADGERSVRLRGNAGEQRARQRHQAPAAAPSRAPDASRSNLPTAALRETLTERRFTPPLRGYACSHAEASHRPLGGAGHRSAGRPRGLRPDRDRGRPELCSAGRLVHRRAGDPAADPALGVPEVEQQLPPHGRSRPRSAGLSRPQLQRRGDRRHDPAPERVAGGPTRPSSTHSTRIRES